ncbi:MAG: hypothetical protein WA418_23285 [Bradyrhizobium sp.]
MSRLRSIPKVGAAAALVSTIVLAAPGAVQAGPAETETVNGQYCNDLCKAYMAWSNRVLAITQSSYTRPQVRVALPQQKKIEKPERMAQHAPKQHRPSNLDSFAQLPSASHAAQSAMDRPQGDDTVGDDGGSRLGRLFATDPTPPRALAEMRGTMTDSASTRLVSMSDPGMQPLTVGEGSGGARSKMPSMWVVLAAGALLVLFGRGWLKRRAREANGLD